MYLECPELLAVSVINDILQSNDIKDIKLKNNVYISFQNMLNKHYHDVNIFDMKCFTKKPMSQNLEEITFSREYKDCVKEYYHLLQQSNCETLRKFGKIMNTLPHEKKSARFLLKLKSVLSRQKGGKVIINGNNTTVVPNGYEPIQGVGLKGAVSSFLKNIVNYDKPGEFDDSTKNLFRMLHTLYSNNMNIFVIVMSKIMNKLYGTKFQFIQKSQIEDQPQTNEKQNQTEKNKINQNNKKQIQTEQIQTEKNKINQNNKKQIQTEQIQTEKNKINQNKSNFKNKQFQTNKIKQDGGSKLKNYYDTLKNQLEEKRNKEFHTECVEKYITKGEILILEMIMKEIKKTDERDAEKKIEQFEKQRIMSNIVFSKPRKNKLIEEKKKLQTGGDSKMDKLDQKNFDIIDREYGPWADNVVKELDDFVTKLNKNPGFQELKNLISPDSIDSAIGTMGTLMSSALAAPALYMNMASGVMNTFGSEMNNTFSPSGVSLSMEMNKMANKIDFYKENLEAFRKVVAELLMCMNILDAEVGFEKLKKIKKVIQEAYKDIKCPTVAVKRWSFFSTKKTPKKTKDDNLENELTRILNRKLGESLSPVEQKLDILVFLYENSSNMLEIINGIDKNNSNQMKQALVNLNKSMESLKNYLENNKPKLEPNKKQGQKGGGGGGRLGESLAKAFFDTVEKFKKITREELMNEILEYNEIEKVEEIKMESQNVTTHYRCIFKDGDIYEFENLTDNSHYLFTCDYSKIVNTTREDRNAIDIISQFKEEDQLKTVIICFNYGGNPGGEFVKYEGGEFVLNPIRPGVVENNQCSLNYSMIISSIISNWLETDKTQLNNIIKKWGFIEPLYHSSSKERFKTLQGKNYYNKKFDIGNMVYSIFNSYNDSWYIKNQVFTKNNTFKTNLIFTIIPNIIEENLEEGNQCIDARTFNKTLEVNPDYYFYGIFSAIITALFSADVNKCETVLISPISKPDILGRDETMNLFYNSYLKYCKFKYLQKIIISN